MTSFEYVSVEQPLNRSPSWIEDVGGDIAEGWGDVEVEEVGVGVAVTTPEEEEEAEEREEVGIAVVGDEQDHSIHNTNTDALWSENDREHVEGRGGVAFFDESRSVARSALGSASHSHSRSGSGSNSRSQSSVREVMEMGESSAATSWTQAEEGVGGRPSGDSGRQPNADQSKSKLKEVIDVEREEEGGALRELGTEVVSLSQPRGVEDRGRDVSRKEEVLVMQEEDIGEGWHSLRYNGKARLQDDEKAEGEEGEEDVGSVHALESIHGGDRSLEMDEKERSQMFGSSGRNTRHLRLEFKPSSPQPWDEIDPPGETYGSDYYSTLNSKTFGTLQKKWVSSIFSFA